MEQEEDFTQTDEEFKKGLREIIDSYSMPKEMQDCWENLKEFSKGELLANNLQSFDEIFTETEYLMALCKKYQYDIFMTRELFLKYQFLDNSDKYNIIDGIRIRSPKRLMLIWIYQLTSHEKETYHYANECLAQILDEDDFSVKGINDYRKTKTDHCQIYQNSSKSKPIVNEENPQSNSTSKTKVIEYLSCMSERDSRQLVKRLSEPEFNKLINWVTFYFDNDLLLPEIKDPIQTVHTSQVFIVSQFVSCFDNIKGKVPKRPDSLFDLMRLCFYEFRHYKISNLKSANRNNYKVK